jgi:hypothetical protein
MRAVAFLYDSAPTGKDPASQVSDLFFRVGSEMLQVLRGEKFSVV